MRRMLASTLFFSSVLLNAQTVTKGHSAMLFAHAEAASAASASGSAQPVTDAAIPSPTRRVTTGVTSPKLISEPAFTVSVADFPTRDVASQQMVVAFRVDEKGIPQNVHLLKSVSQAVDSRVLDVVREYRYIPAKLDDQNVAVDVNLIVNFAKR
jgi:outer membrane biosynthesis protein TonB